MEAVRVRSLEDVDYNTNEADLDTKETDIWHCPTFLKWGLLK